MIPLSSMPSLCDIDAWKRARIGTFTQFKGNLSIKGKDRNDTVMQSTRIKTQLSIKRLEQERHCYAVCTYPKRMYQLKVRGGGTLLCCLHVSKENVSIKGEGRNDTVMQSPHTQRDASIKGEGKNDSVMLSKGNVSIKGEGRNDTVILSKGNVSIKGEGRNDSVMQSKARRSDTVMQSTRFQR